MRLRSWFSENPFESSVETPTVRVGLWPMCYFLMVGFSIKSWSAQGLPGGIASMLRMTVHLRSSKLKRKRRIAVFGLSLEH